MLWLNFILGLIFIFFCINFIIIHYHTQKQKKIKIKPRIKLNHNIHTEIVVGTLWCRLLLKVCRISCILLLFFRDLSSNNIRDLPEDLFASLRDLERL